MSRAKFRISAGNLIGKYGFDKFVRLARNSFKANNYALTADNCRLAVNIALAQNNLNEAEIAYELWIRALFEQDQYPEIKKICCEARSKFGNSLDLLYYEFKAAVNARDNKSAVGLAKEFIELHKNSKGNLSSFFNKTIDKLKEVTAYLKEVDNAQPDKHSNLKAE